MNSSELIEFISQMESDLKAARAFLPILQKRETPVISIPNGAQIPLIPTSAPVEQGDYGANRRAVLDAIAGCPDNYTITDVQRVLIERGSELPKSAISQALSRLAKKNEIQVLTMGRGRKATIFKK